MRRFLLVLFLLHAHSASALVAEKWRFAVTIDDRPVGFHSFEVMSDDGEQRISSQAQFNVKVLFVNVFRYVHENTERWRADCLDTIDSSTRMNNESYQVQGAQDGGVFRVTSNDATQDLPGCVQTFAYWNPDFLTAQRLLNSQTGELEDVNVAAQGAEQIMVDDQAIAAKRYRIELSKGHIDVWYDVDSDLWLGLESVTAEGRTIRYTPVSLPTT